VQKKADKEQREGNVTARNPAMEEEQLERIRELGPTKKERGFSRRGVEKKGEKSQGKKRKRRSKFPPGEEGESQATHHPRPNTKGRVGESMAVGKKGAG